MVLLEHIQSPPTNPRLSPSNTLQRTSPSIVRGRSSSFGHTPCSLSLPDENGVFYPKELWCPTSLKILKYESTGSIFPNERLGLIGPKVLLHHLNYPSLIVSKITGVASRIPCVISDVMNSLNPSSIGLVVEPVPEPDPEPPAPPRIITILKRHHKMIKTFPKRIPHFIGFL